MVKNLSANAGNARDVFNPCVGKIPWSRKWQPVQYSCLENPIERRAWQATAHGVAKSLTQLSATHRHTHRHTHTHTHIHIISFPISTKWERKTLMLEMTEGKEGEKQRMRWSGSLTYSMNMTLWKLQEILKDRRGWHAIVLGVTKSWKRLRNSNYNN